MAATLVQTVQGNGGGYVNTYTSSITVTAGNFLTITVGCGSGDTVTVTDNKSNTYVQDASSIRSGDRQAIIIHAGNLASGATTVTFTFNNYVDTAFIIQEWSGMPATVAVDVVATAVTNSGSSYAVSDTTTNATDLLIGAIAGGTSTPGYTGDAAWSNLLTQGGFDIYTSVATQYRNVTAVNTYSWTLTSGTAITTAQAIVSYKGIPAGGGGSSPGSLLLTGVGV